MSTRYNLTHPEEDAFATDKRTGKKVCLQQKIKGTDYYIAIEEKISQIQAAGSQNKLFNKTNVLEYLLVKSLITVLECEEEFLEVRGDFKDFEIIDFAIETIKMRQGEK